jgi:hypothetical protein
VTLDFEIETLDNEDTVQTQKVQKLEEELFPFEKKVKRNNLYIFSTIDRTIVQITIMYTTNFLCYSIMWTKAW